MPLTLAVVIVNSISPFAALINVPNFSTTPSNSPNLLFSASAERKFLTVPDLSAPPVCFSSSAMMADLSESWRVGAAMMVCTLGSCLRTFPSEEMALAVLSRADCLAAAVYYGLLVEWWDSG